MKRIIICIIFIAIGWLNLCAQSDHILPAHQHRTSGNGVCYGYAMGRSGNAQGACNPATIVRADAGQDDANANLNWSVDGAYWAFHAGSTLTGVGYGDIIAFGTGHVSYASFVTDHPSGGYIIQVEDILGFGGSVNTGVNLERVQVGGQWHYKRNSSLEATGYYERKIFPVTARNRFYDNGDVYNQGRIKIAWEESGSPMTRDKDWAYSTFVEAILGQEYPSGYPQVYQYWVKPGGSHITTNPLEIRLTSGDNTYTAYFEKQLSITFQNNLPGASGGQIKVNGNTHPAPYTEHVFARNPPQGITGEAINQEINRISYTFSSWSSGSTSRHFIPLLTPLTLPTLMPSPCRQKTSRQAAMLTSMCK